MYIEQMQSVRIFGHQLWWTEQIATIATRIFSHCRERVTEYANIDNLLYTTYTVRHVHVHCIYTRLKWVSVLHHVCDEHQWTTGECSHDSTSDRPTMADGTVIPYFYKDDADFAALQKIVLDERRMKSLKFHVRSR